MNKYIKKIRNKIIDSSLVQGLLDFSKSHSFPGFGRVPIYDVIRFIVLEARRDRMNTRSNAMAFSFFISLFPFLILVFSIITFLPVDNFREEVKTNLSNVLPDEAESYILGLINNALDAILVDASGGLLSIGAVFSLYFASNGMLSMMRGFDKSYDIVFNRRNFLLKRGVAILLTILVGFLLALSVIGIVAGKAIINWVLNRVHLDNLAFIALQLLRWAVLVLLIYTIITMLYRYGAAMTTKMRFFSPGATLATILSILSSILFSYFVNNFSNYNQFYGSLAALIIMLLWIKINCFVLLVGFELNASIAVNRSLIRERDD